MRASNYLDQPAIVTRASANTLAMANFDHWAEPLPEGFARVLAENLAQRLPRARVAIFPMGRADSDKLQVLVRVARFEVASGQARRTAEWRLLSGVGGEILSQRSSFTESVPDAGSSEVVAAMSKTLTRLSEEIADAIQDQTRR